MTFLANGFLAIDKIGKTGESTKKNFPAHLWLSLEKIGVRAPSIPHFKALGMRHLQYEILNTPKKP